MKPVCRKSRFVCGASALALFKSNLIPIRSDEPRRMRFWEAIEGVFLSRAFSGALAAVMLALTVRRLAGEGRDQHALAS